MTDPNCSPSPWLDGEAAAEEEEAVIDLQVFTSDGLWTKPANARWVQVIAFAGGGGGVDLQGTGDLGERILASVPPDQQGFVQPLIPGIVQAIYDSVSIAIASSFWVGIVGAIVAVIVVVFLPEVPMRSTFEMPEPEPEPAGS